jgi:hypothetical protein
MKRLLLLLMLLLVGCAPNAPAVVPSDPVEKEEYAVYSALINSEFGQGPLDTLAIDNQTTRGCGPFADMAVDELEDQFAGLNSANPNLQGLEQSTIDSYVDKNRVKHQLTDSFSLVARHALVPIGSDTTDTTQVSLSAVGLNTALDQALVCAGTLTTSKSGAGFTIGHYFLLQKENGAWAVKARQQKWIS